jgi:multiple sugar transport system permease protein
LSRFLDDGFTRLVIVPLLVTLLSLAVLPFALMVWYGLTDLSFNLPGHDGTFVGLDNFRSAFSDARLWASARTTLWFIAATVPVECILGFSTALMLNSESSVRRFYLPLIALPVVIAPVTVGLAWRLLLHGDYGPVAWLLLKSGLFKGGSILGETSSAFWAVVVVDIWQWTPFFTIVLLAALKAIPRQPYESAMIDGAGRRDLFLTITLPLIWPTVMIALLFRVIDSFKEFDKIFVLTQGGPASSTELLSIFVWIVSFEHGDLGYGSAVSLLMFLAVEFGCLLLIWRRRYEAWQ